MPHRAWRYRDGTALSQPRVLSSGKGPYLCWYLVSPCMFPQPITQYDAPGISWGWEGALVKPGFYRSFLIFHHDRVCRLPALSLLHFSSAILSLYFLSCGISKCRSLRLTWPLQPLLCRYSARGLLLHWAEYLQECLRTRIAHFINIPKCDIATNAHIYTLLPPYLRIACTIIASR